MPSTIDRIEEINRYVKSVNLSPTDIDASDFGPNFDPSKLDYAGPQKEGTRESVLKVLKKVVNLSNQNLQRNTDGLLAKKKTHHNNSLLWPGGKRVPTDKFALTY